MRGGRGPALIPTVALAAGALAVAGCGGTRQDAHEASGTFTLAIDRASFPARQFIAQRARLTLVVRNAGQSTAPDIAVTIDSFGKPSAQRGLANPVRPVWIVDAGPTGGDSAYANTWALGALAAGESRTYNWDVTAVKSGSYTVRYTIAAGLNGKARAQLADGQLPAGSFPVTISQAPAQVHVDPSTGRVVRGAPTLPSGA